MKDFHLDLEDKNSVLDFLVQAGFYANKKDKAIAKDLVDMCESDERISNEKIAHVARELAISTWPARSAVNYFFKKKAAGDEWIKVTEMVRPATATLMHRFRKGAGARTLDSLLEHPDIGDSFGDKEILEIQEVRKNVRKDFWDKEKSTIKELVKEQTKDLEEYKKRFEKLRELATVFEPVIQDEVYSKLRHFEDRVLFKLELVSLEILDEEILYYTEQKEIPPERWG